jgi:hypothetical protein
MIAAAAEPGDMLVTAMPDGTFQIARVPTNGRADHVLGYQRTQVAALRVAWSATSGAQRVFLRATDTGGYQLAEST